MSEANDYDIEHLPEYLAVMTEARIEHGWRNTPHTCPYGRETTEGWYRMQSCPIVGAVVDDYPIPIEDADHEDLAAMLGHCVWWLGERQRYVEPLGLCEWGFIKPGQLGARVSIGRYPTPLAACIAAIKEIANG